MIRCNKCTRIMHLVDSYEHSNVYRCRYCGHSIIIKNKSIYKLKNNYKGGKYEKLYK